MNGAIYHLAILSRDGAYIVYPTTFGYNRE
jgi:hypothetical protein